MTATLTARGSNWLRSLSAWEVLKGSTGDNFNLVSFRPTDSLLFVLKTMKNTGISGAAVLSEKHPGHLSGTIDMLDIVTFICAKFGVSYPNPASAKRSLEGFQQPVEDVLNISGRDFPRSVTTTMPSGDLLRLLSLPNTHRVILTNESQVVTGLVTQSMVVKWLYANKEKLPPAILQEKVENLFPLAPVHTIKQDSYVIDAFTDIYEKQVSGLAVVNDRGQIVANISASDVKYLLTDNLMDLSSDVYARIADLFDLAIDTPLPNAPVPKGALFHRPVVISPKNTLEELMDIVQSKKVHRVYLADNERIPERVISLGDIIAVFAGLAITAE